MHILCAGLNHQTASIQLRERLAFSDDAAKAALARLGCGGMYRDTVSEIVILSTCNRVELYAVATEETFGALESFLSEARGVPAAEFENHLYRLSGEQAAEHLLRVAA